MSSNYQLLTRLLAGVLKHQAKKYLGEEVLATLAEVGSEHLSDRLLDLLGAQVATTELTRKLTTAIASAAEELDREQGTVVHLLLDEAPPALVEAVVHALANLDTGDLLGRRLQAAVQDLVAAIGGPDPHQSLQISIQLYQALLMSVLTIPDVQPRAQDLLLQSRMWILSEQIRRMGVLAAQSVTLHPTASTRGRLGTDGQPAFTAPTREALSAATIAPGRLVALGAVELLRPLARGGHAALWLGRHLPTSSVVAVKILHAEFNEVPEASANFEAEARALGTLASDTTPRLVAGPLMEGGLHLYVMEYFEQSVTFAELVNSVEVPAYKKLQVISRAASVVHQLHQNGFIHGDVKPANVIVLQRDESVRIIDFGSARRIGPHEASEAVTFTYAYAAPELVSRHSTRIGSSAGTRGVFQQFFSPALDIYSLGVILFQAIDPGLWQIARREEFYLVERLVVSDRLKSVLRRALAPDPQERYSTAREFCAALGLAASIS